MESNLTVRRFATAIASMAAVLVAGMVAFELELHEGWLHSLYRAVVTTSLTGLDSTPQGKAAMVTSIVLVLAGVAIFGYVAAIIVEVIAGDVLSGVLAERRRRRAIEALHDHFIICGYGRVGRRVAEEFRRSEIDYVVLDYSDEAVAAAREAGELLIVGNATEDQALERAGLSRARGLVAASNSDTDNLYIALSARTACPGLTIVARASDEEAAKKLRLAGADRVVLPFAIAGRVMANLLAKPQVAAFLNMVSTPGGVDFQFEQIEVTGTCSAAGRSIGELRVKEQTGAVIVAVQHVDGVFDRHPDGELVLVPGDVLIGVGTLDEIRALERLFAPQGSLAR